MTVGPSPSFNQVTVEWGPFIYLNGTVPTGTLEVDYNGGEMLDPAVPPAYSVRIGEGTKSRMQVPVTTISLDVGGESREFAFASFEIPGSNDPDILGGGGTYTVTPKLSGGGGTPVTFLADIDAGVIRLNDITPTDPVQGGVIPTVTYADYTALVAQVEAVANAGIDEAAVTTIVDSSLAPVLADLEDKADAADVGALAALDLTVPETDLGGAFASMIASALADMQPTTLARHTFNPISEAISSTTSSTPSNIDATNLRTGPFTFPDSGKITVTINALVDAGTAANQFRMNLRNANGDVDGATVVATRAASTSSHRVHVTIPVEGTPGAESDGYFIGYASSNNTNPVRILSGAHWGPTILEVMSDPFDEAALPPLSPTVAAATSAFTNAAQSWWTSPRGVQNDGELYFGIVQNDGEIAVRHVAANGDESELLLGTFEIDDHNNPAIVVVPDKPMLAFYNRHGDDDYIRMKKGVGPIEDGFGPLGDELLLGMTGDASYVEPRWSGDTVWVWCRISGRYWGFVKSNDWGDNWVAAKRVFDKGDTTQKMYMASRLLADGETLRCTFANHPADAGGGIGGDPSVFYAEVNMTTGDITTGDVVVENLNTMATPVIVPTTCEKVANITGDQRVWVFDVGDGLDPAVTFMDFDGTAPNSGAMYRYAIKSDETWTVRPVVEAGAPFQGAPNYYYGGAQIGVHGTVYTARKDPSGSGVYYVERHVTSDDGTTWATTVLASSSDILARPWPIDGGTPGREVTYNRFSDFTSYTIWTGDLAVA